MIYSIVNQKGGVGKTTVTANLGYLSSLKKRVLMIDLDPQAGLSTSLNYRVGEQGATAKDFLLQGIFEPIHIRDGLDLIPSNLELATADAALFGKVGFERTLKKAIAGAGDGYDNIFIDCPPSLGVLTANALVASNKVIVPVQCEFLSMKALTQLVDVINGAKEVNEALTYKLVFTMYSRCTAHAPEIVSEIQEHYPCYKSILYRTIQYPYSATAGKPLAEYDKNSKHTKILKKLHREVIKDEKQKNVSAKKTEKL